MHRPLFLATVGSVAAVGGLIAASALPAGAATAVRAETMAICTGVNVGAVDCADTTVTFTVTSNGTLSITAPASLALGEATVTGTTGDLLTRPFATPVTVTDNRASATDAWTASVSSTAFKTAAGTANETIPASAVLYTTGTVTAATVGGSAAPATGADTPGLRLSGTPQPAVTQVSYDGDNGASWTPTLALTVPAGAVVGAYTGTVTHSVA